MSGRPHAVRLLRGLLGSMSFTRHCGRVALDLPPRSPALSTSRRILAVQTCNSHLAFCTLGLDDRVLPVSWVNLTSLVENKN